MAKKSGSWHTCDMCGSTFKDGNNIFNEPNGIAFVIPKCGTVTLCNKCVKKVSEMSDFEKEMYLDEVKRKAH